VNERVAQSKEAALFYWTCAGDTLSARPGFPSPLSLSKRVKTVRLVRFQKPTEKRGAGAFDAADLQRPSPWLISEWKPPCSDLTGGNGKGGKGFASMRGVMLPVIFESKYC